MPKGMSYLTIEQIEKIIKLTSLGLTRQKIADSVGVAKSTVYLYQKKYKLI